MKDLPDSSLCHESATTKGAALDARSNGSRLGGMTLIVCLVAFFLVGGVPRAEGAPSMTRDEILCWGSSGVGFSYWWGGSCWRRNGCNPDYSGGRGTCSGNCPNCTHGGAYGADCSGFLNKVWQVPGVQNVTTCSHGPYTASSYTRSATYWDAISRDSLRPADALASQTHVVLYRTGSPWGSLTVYEARGCSYGIVHNTRTFGSTYSVARRKNLSECECTPGQTQSQPCGNCGTQSRTCTSQCAWGLWGTCQNQGVCSPGAQSTRACDNCGTQVRTCTSSCTWGNYGACQGQGVCVPGSTEAGACGNCGQRQRACTSACQWGAWGACGSEGVCSPGAAQSDSCGDCGTWARTCTGGCDWGPWGDCSGPDPQEGTFACHTGEQGRCAEGRKRCVGGWLGCARILEPEPELCDGTDNDCNGFVDDGYPQLMGATPPAWAALLEDYSYPSYAKPGEEHMVWAEFRNVGSQSWQQGELWLETLSGEISAWGVKEKWAAWDVAAVLDSHTAPGQTARFSFPISAPPMSGWASETFRLVTSSGLMIACPDPLFKVEVHLGADNSSSLDFGDYSPERQSSPVPPQTLTMRGHAACHMVAPVAVDRTGWWPGRIIPVVMFLLVFVYRGRTMLSCLNK